MAEQRVSGCAVVAGLVVLFAIGNWLTGGSVPDAPPPPVLDTAKRAACEKVLGEAGKIGLIRARPSATRIDVDEVLWAQLPADTKKRTLAAVSCVALGRWAPVRIGEGPVVAYGYRSGKRAAMLSTVGFSLE